uniref:Transcriptional adapter 2-alpha n=1 Tax=Takifugu rubripes TaxID=31033 RepID=A0A674NSK9_TAKRU
MERLASFGNDPFDKPPCRGCSSYLTEPYIKCADCGPSHFLLCLQCFTRGFEYKKHKSDHRYEIMQIVMTSNFILLSWQDVAYQMRTKTKEECESHYMKNFINNPLFSSTLLSLRKTKDSHFAEGAVPFRPCDDPPRPTFDSVMSRDMAGYMPARADFMEEFDNYAEWDLKDIDFVDDDSDILRALKLSVSGGFLFHIFSCYDCFCLSRFLLPVLERCYPKEVQELYEAMRRFARVAGPMEHDKFIESHACYCLFLFSARVYERVKRMREDERRKRTMLCDVLHYINDGRACQQWLSKQAAIDAGITPAVTTITPSGRRSAPPLNLTGLPGTEKLNEREKELCQVVRLVPGAYLEYKQALLNECRRQGGLRLAQARALIKIDVNKTRKIYDFLIKEGHITKA